MANKEKLFSEFQAPTTQEWLDNTAFGILHRKGFFLSSVRIKAKKPKNNEARSQSHDHESEKPPKATMKK